MRCRSDDSAMALIHCSNVPASSTCSRVWVSALVLVWAALAHVRADSWRLCVSVGRSH